MTNIKYTCFGKVTYSGKKNEVKELEKLQQKKITISKSTKDQSVKRN